MSLHTLLHQLDPHLVLRDVPDVPITGVNDDSRLVRPGDLFIARSGVNQDGRQFVADALAGGAAAVLTPTPLEGLAVPQVVLSDTAAAVSPLANIFYGNPSNKVIVSAVTGTNGKTTVTYLLRHLLAAAGHRCGMVGTVEIDDGKSIQPASMTTPGAVHIAQLLANMRDAGAGACAIEISSHALHQYRASGVRFAGAAFTNLTRDHLDYHQTMENYAAAKAMLFESLDEKAVAVINGSDAWSPRIIRKCRAKVVCFGLTADVHYRATDVAMAATGSSFVLHTPAGSAAVRTPLIGLHNVANILTAAALAAEVYGLSPEIIAQALASASGAPGRLQPVSCGQEFGVFVDYAHTDDGLKNVLAALRPLTNKRLRVLFGCGGDRDRTKRPIMAQVAEQLADVIYVTSDNPRGESPAAIISQIVAGFTDTGKTIIVEPDRRTAIGRIIDDAESGDVVLLAGKGHENYQIVGSTKHHFDDVEESMRALTAGR